MLNLPFFILRGPLFFCKDDAGGPAAVAINGADGVAGGVCHKADGHHGAAVLADEGTGIHLDDLVVDGVVVIAQGHGDDFIVKLGGDGADIVVVVDFRTQDFADGPVGDVGAPVFNEGRFVHVNAATVNVHGQVANAQADGLRRIAVGAERDENRLILAIEANAEQALAVSFAG